MTNYGNFFGKEDWVLIEGLTKEECRALIGAERDDETIVYAAFGSMGCHTYLDFYGRTTVKHADTISGAWTTC